MIIDIVGLETLFIKTISLTAANLFNIFQITKHYLEKNAISDKIPKIAVTPRSPLKPPVFPVAAILGCMQYPPSKKIS